MKTFMRSIDNYADLNWTAGSPSKRLALPRVRFIQKLGLSLLITGDTDDGGGPVANEDLSLALLKAIRLVVGGDTLVNLSGKDLAYMNQYELGRAPNVTLIDTADQTGVTLGEADLILPFMLNPANDGDFNALLPAHMQPALDLFIDWGDSSDLGTGYTVTAATIKVTLKEVSANQQDLAALGPIWRVKYSALEKIIDASYSSYLFKVDMPVGKILERAWLYGYDNSIRDDTVVTDFKLSDVDNEFIRMPWLESQQALATWAGLTTALAGKITGFTSVGLERLSPLGLDCRQYKAGDLSLGMITAPDGGDVPKVRVVTKEIW